MDLSAIKKNIESGVIRTTAEFQRDIMLMFQNAVMYNSSDHDVYHMALEMQRDVLEHVQQFLATQLIMQTSESAISAKSLRGREGNRKPGEPAEKVSGVFVYGQSYSSLPCSQIRIEMTNVMILDNTWKDWGERSIGASSELLRHSSPPHDPSVCRDLIMGFGLVCTY